jgi:hypothetical protein
MTLGAALFHHPQPMQKSGRRVSILSGAVCSRQGPLLRRNKKQWDICWKSPHGSVGRLKKEYGYDEKMHNDGHRSGGVSPRAHGPDPAAGREAGCDKRDGHGRSVPYEAGAIPDKGRQGKVVARRPYIDNHDYAESGG